MRNRSQNMMEQMVSEVTDIMEKITTHNGPIGKIENPLIVQHNLEMWQKFFTALNEALGEAQLNNSAQSETTPEQEALIKRAKELELKGRALEKAIPSEFKKKPKKSTKKGTKDADLQQQIKERKKLFKTIGGDKKWIPM